jgi:3-deoxy-D-manno-octulosonate 8-phosphate phosphatase (KDO 8-P phosphatase)
MSKILYAGDTPDLAGKIRPEAGWKVLFLTARNSPPARRRAEEMGAECALGVGNKEQFLVEWLAGHGLDWDEIAYIGDDLQDLLPLRRVGYPITVANGVREVREVVRHVTRLRGGEGAVREAVEWLLDEFGIREETVQRFVERKGGFSVGTEEQR